MLRIVDWSEKKRQSKIVTAFLERSAFPEEAEKAAKEKEEAEKKLEEAEKEIREVLEEL